jgi:hypothetical protein
MDYIEQLRRWKNNIPALFNGKFRKDWLAAMQRKSMRKAVNAKCADCTCWQNTEIRECTVITCPLWQYRPLKNPQTEKAVKKAVLTFLQEQ